VLRGGSWNNDQDNVRCAARDRNDPNNRNNENGFRLLLAHIFLEEILPAIFRVGGPVWATRQTGQSRRGIEARLWLKVSA
jgi:hypothetical protein